MELYFRAVLRKLLKLVGVILGSHMNLKVVESS